MRLVDGADAIRGDLPVSSTVVVEIPLEAGESLGSGVHRYSSLQLVRDRQLDVLDAVPGTAITIGGDCGVELAAISHLAARRDVAVVWFDAHPDLNTPESSTSGAFTGMVLRTLLGEGAPGLVPETPLARERVLLVGCRDFDDAEDEFVTSAAIPLIPAEAASADQVVDAVVALGADAVYVHIDLDVIDPGDFDGVGSPEPFGIPAVTLLAIVGALAARVEIAGAGITSFAPSSPEHAVDDLPTILRLIAALTR
nr:arginase family protein [Galbitalea soli]